MYVRVHVQVSEFFIQDNLGMLILITGTITKDIRFNIPQ